MTSNDLEMTFNSVFSTYLIFGPSYCPLKIKKMEITPPYYHRYHTLVYIFKKICSEKATFEFFYEVWYGNIYLLFLCHNQHPYQYQTHIIRLGSRRRYHLKKDHPNICFHRKVMSYFRNLRWPPSAAILDFQNWTYLYKGSRYRHSLFF